MQKDLPGSRPTPGDPPSTAATCTTDEGENEGFGGGGNRGGAAPWEKPAAYHHFSSVSRTTSMLAGFLKPRGWLLVTDLRTPPPTDADSDSSQLPISGPAPGEFDKIIVEKHGFSDDVGTSLFRTAGLEEVSMQDVPGAILDGSVFGQPDTQRQIFLLKGRKPQE